MRHKTVHILGDPSDMSCPAVAATDSLQEQEHEGVVYIYIYIYIYMYVCICMYAYAHYACV